MMFLDFILDYFGLSFMSVAFILAIRAINQLIYSYVWDDKKFKETRLVVWAELLVYFFIIWLGHLMMEF